MVLLVPLMRMLSPRDRNARVAYNWQLVVIIASPRMYRDGIDRYNLAHPTTPFVEQTGPDYMFRRAEFPLNIVENISLDNVIQSLIANGVPPAWIDHAYLYGLHAMANSFDGSALHEDMYREHDSERYRRLMEFGVPPAIPEWDGWRYPSTDDYRRVLLMTNQEDKAGHEDTFEDGRWLLVGESPYFARLADGPHRQRCVLGMAPPSTVETHDDGAVDNTAPQAGPSGTSHSEPQAMDEAPDITVPVDQPANPAGEQTVTSTTEATDTVASDQPPAPGSA